MRCKGTTWAFFVFWIFLKFHPHPKIYSLYHCEKPWAGEMFKFLKHNGVNYAEWELHGTQCNFQLVPINRDYARSSLKAVHLLLITESSSCRHCRLTAPCSRVEGWERSRCLSIELRGHCFIKNENGLLCVCEDQCVENTSVPHEMQVGKRKKKHPMSHSHSTK